MKELVIISGKGGTGKTSIVAAFAALANKKVLADCDVDAADLHLILDPQIERREIFKGGKQARVKAGHCIACDVCEEVCAYDAIHYNGPGNGKVDKTFQVDPIACEGCGVCAHFCPCDAIEFSEVENGHWFISHTRFGYMVHAQLGIAEENSGKLVTLVRNQAAQLALTQKLELVIIDGPPGIGCPVIASIAGTDLVLVVTEPTLSALHDLERVRELTRHFDIPTLVCINKFDLNEEISVLIEKRASEIGARVIGKIHYDLSFTKAQIMKESVVEHSDGPIAKEIRFLWQQVANALE